MFHPKFQGKNPKLEIRSSKQIRNSKVEGNPKFEIRSSKQIQNPKSEFPLAVGASFGFRASDFGFTSAGSCMRWVLGGETRASRSEPILIWGFRIFELVSDFELRISDLLQADSNPFFQLLNLYQLQLISRDLHGSSLSDEIQAQQHRRHAVAFLDPPFHAPQRAGFDFHATPRADDR